MTTQTLLASVEAISLKNGGTLLVKPFEGAPRTAFSIFLPGGNTLDPVPGYMDILDRLLMKGTQTRTQEQLAIEIDSLTLEVDVDTRRDYSHIHATFLEEDWEPALEIIQDLFFNATFQDLEREQEKLAGEITMDLDSPRACASDQFIRTIFQNTPYNAVGSLILENLPNLPDKEAFHHYYKQVYQPQRAIFSVGGDNLKINQIQQWIENAFPKSANLAETSLQDQSPKLNGYHLKESHTVTYPKDDSSQCHIFKGWLAPAMTHEDYPALVVLNTILGGAGLSSRLFLELRDKQGLAYNVRSSYEAFKHSGLFSLYIGTEPKNKEKCLTGFIEESRKLMEVLVSHQELADAKENILGRRSIYLETAPQLASFIGANYTLGRTLKDIEALPERIQAVTSQQVQAVAQSVLGAPSVVSVAAPSSVL